MISAVAFGCCDPDRTWCLNLIRLSGETGFSLIKTLRPFDLVGISEHIVGDRVQIVGH